VVRRGQFDDASTPRTQFWIDDVIGGCVVGYAMTGDS